MKYLILLCLLVLFGCSKNPNNPVTPTTPNNPTTNTYYWSHFIPNWYNGDTLVGYVTDSLLNAQGVFEDTIYTKRVNDTSYIIHKGKQFYIWAAAWSSIDTFKTDKQFYINIVVNDRLDTVNAYSYSTLSSAYGHKYKDKMSNWAFQNQVLMLTDQDPKYDRFKAFNGFYQALNKKY